MAHKLDSNTICTLLDNLIGETEPVADSSKDFRIEENVKTVIEVLNWSLDTLYETATYRHSGCASVRCVGERAYSALAEIKDWCEKKVEELA